MSVFVDTSAWYAIADASDRHHHRARQRLEEFSDSLVTSDHVLVETWFLAESRLGLAIAERLVNEIRAGIARVVPATLTDLDTAARIYDAFNDQAFSIVDRTSWAIMQRLGIREAVSFDRDFLIYRFGAERRQAFTVHT